MEENVSDNEVFVNATIDGDSRSAVNSLILDYYQKFGKKRDLEQFFSLSTADSDIRDPSSLFWRKMKMQSDSSDSGEGKAGTSTELCRISIKCSVPEHTSSPDDTPKSKDDSVSPPIIIEEAASPLQTDHHSPHNSDNESVKSDDNNSQKSIDPQLETSINKPFSPTSSITSQRKLEWDSLGDVGYGNESDRKTSGSGLSTLERLALHQQYSNNDPLNDTKYGLPTSQSTPVETSIPYKSKKGNVKKTTRFSKKDVDFVEVNVPHSSDKGPINVNLTKHISLNVDKDGDVTIETSKNNVISPEKISVITQMTPQVRIDKEIQTTLPHIDTKKSTGSLEKRHNVHGCGPRFPILLSLNTLRKKKRRKKLTMYRKKFNKCRKKSNSSNLPEKSGDQISAAESFEYMPGHIYNQNQVNNSVKDSNSVGNKSSLESSVGFTTDSSKVSKNSFTRDLEKSIKLLKGALQSKYNNTNLKEKLIKEVVQRLIKSQYSDDDSGTVFLSGLSFNSENLGLQKRSNTTTSTSDGNEIDNVVKKPKKSILRVHKFNPSGMASTSQSTPNLCTLSQTEKNINVVKTPSFSNTESELSSRERNSTDTMPKMSSEDLYNKYLDALKREQVHKILLKNKETLLKKKLVCSDTCIKAMPEPHEKTYDRLYKLVKELAQNNIGDGSGDAANIETGSNSMDQKNNIKSQKNHSVFTLSSGKSVRQSKHAKKYSRDVRDAPEAGCSRVNNNCCCHSQHQHNTNCACKKNESEKISDGVTYYGSNKEDKNDVNSNKQYIKIDNSSPRSMDTTTYNKADVQYVCLCAKEATETQDVPDKLLIYKCSRLDGPQRLGLDVLSKASSSVGIQCSTDCVCPKKLKNTTTTTNSLDQSNNKTRLHIIQSSTTVINSARKASNSSQTYSNIDVLLRSQFSDTTNTCTERRASEYMKEKYLPPYKQGFKTTAKLTPMTRTTQTEISIDPQISDPTLSDVRFMSDYENVDNSERCGSGTIIMPKQALCYKTKQHIENEEETFHSIYGSQTNTIDDRNEMGNMKGSDGIDTDTTRKHDLREKPNLRDSKYNEDKFSIPIKGTNMTLVVSLGANTPTNDDAKTYVGTKQHSQNNNQNKVSTRKNSTEEDYSRGVQCTSTDIFTQMNNESQKIKERDIRLRNQPNPSTCCTSDDIKLTCQVNKCVNENSTKYSTYPTKSQTAKKPFIRANTDTHSMQSFVTNIKVNKKVDVETQKNFICDAHQKAFTEFPISKISSYENVAYNICKSNEVNNQNFSKKSRNESKSDVEHGTSKDPILNMIQEITKRYTKKDMEKGKRKKCFKEIITVLNYLLDTDESSSAAPQKGCLSCSNTDGASTVDQMQHRGDSEYAMKKSYVDKGIQMTMKKNKKDKSSTESSDIPTSSEVPTTSTDSAACKVLNKIKKECERYHHKRCSTQSTHSTHKKRDEYSSTTINCENCNREHYCSCRSKCKYHKLRSSAEKVKKKAVAYNLIIQTSDSVASEETMYDEGCRPIKNVIVKVPSKLKGSTAPFQEVSSKIEKNLPQCSRFGNKIHRSKSLPIDSEMSSEDFSKKIRTCTVRDYLEMNRPDFIDKTARRQDCLKIINQTRAGETCGPQGLKMIVVHAPKCTHTNCMEPCHVYCSGMPLSCNQCPNSVMQSLHNDVTGIGESNERSASRKLLSQQLERQQTINFLSGDDLQHLARQLSGQLRRKNVAPKFINEREMKKHSEKIYKSLPEVVQKKEELRKENNKKTNLLMANIFRKNLQKKTLKGSINLSNYSAVVKI